MKAILISAGQGSRLLPLTLEMPKCLVQVGGRAIIDHQLDALAAAGIADVIVVGGYRHAQIADHLARRGDGRVTLALNPFWAVSSSIGSVWAARAHLTQPFCLMNGDTIFAPALVSAARAAAAAGVNLVVEPLRAAEPDDMRVGVAQGRVTAVAKTLAAPQATHRSLGLILSTRADGDYARALEAVIGAPGGHDAFHHAVIDRLARDGAVTAIETDARWQEIDRPEDIARWTGAV